MLKLNLCLFTTPPECLRDIGLEEELMRVGNAEGAMQHTRWCYSMAGEEFARVYSWGSDPRRKVFAPRGPGRGSDEDG